MQKIEKSLLYMETISNIWVSLSSMHIALDMTFGIICGVGLFFLLIPFLKKYPVSPPPKSKMDMPKVRRAVVHTQWSCSLLLSHSLKRLL